MDSATEIADAGYVGRVAAVVALLVLLSCQATGAAGPRLIVGVDDDTAKWLVRPDGLVGVNRDLGIGAMRIMVPWHGQRVPSRTQQVYLHRVALTVALGQRVVLAIYGRERDAPVTPALRDAYCSFAEHVFARIPQLQDVVVWNEVNNPRFWPRSAGATAYEALLARCWDMLHSLRRGINVVDSTAPHQAPAAFLRGLGAAYRASGRMRPILDTFGHNVYPERSTEEPWAQHDNGSIDEGDYATLSAVLAEAFGGTGQPLPGSGRTTIWYLEDGFQTEIPAAKRRLYIGSEPDRHLLPAVAELAPDQSSQLRAAIELAYCQPNVGAFFNFQLIDDHRLTGWQSGLLWADGTRKPSYAAVRDAVAAVRSSSVDCGAFPPQ